NMLGAGSEHEGHFGERRKSRGGGVQQHFANLFAGGGAARFASHGNRKAVGAQGTGQFLDLSALAAAVEAFESDKFSARRHVGDDSRLRCRLMAAGGRRLPAPVGSESDPQTDILTCGLICIAAARNYNPEAEWAQVVG